MNKWNKKPPIAWYKLFTGKEILWLNFFCQIVDAVIASKAIKVATVPETGIFCPISKPSTVLAFE